MEPKSYRDCATNAPIERQPRNTEDTKVSVMRTSTRHRRQGGQDGAARAQHQISTRSGSHLSKAHDPGLSIHREPDEGLKEVP